MPRAGSHKSVPLEQGTIYGCPLASRDDDDDKKMLFIALKVNQLFTALKMPTEVLLRVINALLSFPNGL